MWAAVGGACYVYRPVGGYSSVGGVGDANPSPRHGEDSWEWMCWVCREEGGAAIVVV